MKNENNQERTVVLQTKVFSELYLDAKDKFENDQDVLKYIVTNKP